MMFTKCPLLLQLHARSVIYSSNMHHFMTGSVM